jgi:putative transposase
LHKEIRRGTDVVGIFQGRASDICVVGSLLIGETEEWADERRSMSLEALAKVRPVRFPDADHGTKNALPASLTA